MEHINRHRRILAELCELYDLDDEIAADIEDRWPEGFEHHGEYHHHLSQFMPLLEAYWEGCDIIDLLSVHTRERVMLNIAAPLETPAARRLHKQAEKHFTAGMNALTQLLREVAAHE
jgi:hypothetical protein